MWAERVGKTVTAVYNNRNRPIYYFCHILGTRQQVVTTECPFISWQKFLASFYRIERCQLSCLDVLSTGWQVRIW